jgi:hypothetical protein
LRRKPHDDRRCACEACIAWEKETHPLIEITVVGGDRLTLAPGESAAWDEGNRVWVVKREACR